MDGGREWGVWAEAGWKSVLGSEEESRGDLEKGVPGRGNEPGQSPGVRGAWSPGAIAGFGVAGAWDAVLRG